MRYRSLKVVADSIIVILTKLHRLFELQTRRATLKQVNKVKKKDSAACFLFVCFVFSWETWRVITWDGWENCSSRHMEYPEF